MCLLTEEELMCLMPQGVYVPEAKPELEVASCGAAVLFKQKCWRTKPGNLWCSLGGMARFLLGPKPRCWILGAKLDAWMLEAARRLLEQETAENCGPHSNCTGWDAAVEGSKGAGVFLSSQDVYSLWKAAKDNLERETCNVELAAILHQ